MDEKFTENNVEIGQEPAKRAAQPEAIMCTTGKPES
jgi:hypothetical protein